MARWGVLVTLALVMAAHGAGPMNWRVWVDGAARTAIVYPGKDAATTPAPLVFVFHGFGGAASGMDSMASIQSAWPEATVVYPQGLDVLRPSALQWAPGWPDVPGKYRDRDIRFVDALLESVAAAYRVDRHRVYCTGFSNGATFAYLLYTMHPEPFAAFAADCGPTTFLASARVPRPMMSICATNDGYTPDDMRAEMLAQFCRANRCGPAYTDYGSGYLRYTPNAAGGQPLVWYVHDYGHTWPSTATAQMVRFFIENPLP